MAEDNNGKVNIFVAKGAGFCFGVKRAVDIAFEQAKTNSQVYTFGPIIHNPQVVQSLEQRGVKTLSSGVAEGINESHTIIIRTHGIPLETYQALKTTGCKIIDATCPFVKKAQNYAKILSDQGYQVVIVGDREHPEVKGLLSYAGKEGVVVNSLEEIPKLKNRVGIVVQTTQPKALLKAVVSKILDKVKELVIHNTICNSTDLRMKETLKLTRRADVIFVVGGKNSANTTQLTRLCLSKNIPTYHIETASEIETDWIKGVRNIGITAGASTPDWIINDVIKSIRNTGGYG